MKTLLSSLLLFFMLSSFSLSQDIYLNERNISEKRRQNRIKWVYMIFLERFGSFGVDMLGGEKNILRLLNHADIINLFDEVQTLEKMLWKAISDSRLPASSSSAS